VPDLAWRPDKNAPGFGDRAVDLDRIAAERNGRTRQILGFTTPSQALTILLP
jgi:hypothetical protein